MYYQRLLHTIVQPIVPGIIIPRAELVQAGVRVIVAAGVLPGVAHRLVLVQAQTIGVIVVAVFDVATAIDHFQDRAEVVHQVVDAIG